MKKILLACSIFLLGNNLINAQTLSAGDIAFIGYDTDANDGFTFIALAPIPSGEVIYFTDKGWHSPSSSWFSNAEDNLEWTAPIGGIPCGGIINITETGTDIFTTTLGTVIMSVGSSSWIMSAGDQIIAYRSGSGVFPASPVFITAIHGDYNSSVYDAATTWSNGISNVTTGQSTVPTGLTNGIDCIALFPAPGPELDNNKYTGSLVGTAAGVRSMIHNPANWFGTDNPSAPPRLTIMPGDYSASITCPAACTNPDVPSSLSASASTICPSGSSTLSWTGNLNDATAWHIYTGSCGGTQIGTTASNSLVVSPSATTTYYIRGEDGIGCVDESTGICGSITVIVQDITPPTISCPGSQIGFVNGACNFTLPDYTGLAVAADNCTASPTVTQLPAPGTIIGIGTTNIVLTATDGSSNTANCNFDVMVSDNINPTISCPGNQIGSVDGSCNYSLPDYGGLVVAIDNCPGVSVIQLPAPGTIVGIGTTNIILRAIDGSSNIADCNFDVVVSDNINPSISCFGNQIGSVDGSCNFILPDYRGSGTASDNCGTVIVTQLPAPGTIVGIGTTNIVLTATDGSSNTANCNFDVMVSDNINPSITCPGNQTETPNASCQFTLPDYTGLATTTDNCTASPTVTQSPAPGTVISGATTITLTAADGVGNTSDCTFDVVLNSAASPTLTSVTASADNVCANTPVNLTANGLTLGTGGVFSWYTGSGGTGTNLGNSNPISITPATTATYYAYVTGACNTIEESITITVNSITNQTTTAGTSSFCANGGITTIDLGSSETGVTYYLRDNANDTIIAGPIAGTGASISLNTGNIDSSITYNVFAEKVTSGGALHFDGGNDYVNLGDNIEGLTNFTFETWVYYESGGAAPYYEMFAKNQVNSFNIWNGGTGADKNKIWFHLGTGSSWFSGGRVLSNSPVPTDTWTHIAVTWVQSSGEVNFYINGILDQTVVHTHSGGAIMGSNSSPRGLGAYGDGTFPFKGNIDEFRVWDVIRTQTEIQASMYNCSLSNPNLIANYTMEDGTGSTTVTDVSNGINGTLTNMDASTAWVADNINCGITCNLEMTQTVTVTITTVDTSVTNTVPTLTANQTGATYRWLDCNNNNSVIAGETAQTFTATTNGSYAVEVTQNGCVDTSICITVMVTGIQHSTLNIQNLSIYPNPTNGLFTVSLDKVNTDSRVIVYTVVGTVIVNQKITNNNTVINLEAYDKGIYFVKITNGNSFITQRIVKQ